MAELLEWEIPVWQKYREMERKGGKKEGEREGRKEGGREGRGGEGRGGYPQPITLLRCGYLSQYILAPI